MACQASVRTTAGKQAQGKEGGDWWRCGVIEALLLPRENKPFGPDRSPELVKNPTRNQEGMLLSHSFAASPPKLRFNAGIQLSQSLCSS